MATASTPHAQPDVRLDVPLDVQSASRPVALRVSDKQVRVDLNKVEDEGTAAPLLCDDSLLAANFHQLLATYCTVPANPKVLDTWFTYDHLLTQENVPAPRRTRLYALYSRAHQDLVARRRSRRYDPEVNTSIEEIRAETAAEFVDLLATIVSRSGVSRAEIARRTAPTGPAHVGTSQVYSILQRGVLPRKGGQVRAIAEAAGLSQFHVRRLLAVWADLSGTRLRPQPPQPEVIRSAVLDGSAAAMISARMSKTAQQKALTAFVANLVADTKLSTPAKVGSWVLALLLLWAQVTTEVGPLVTEPVPA